MRYEWQRKGDEAMVWKTRVTGGGARKGWLSLLAVMGLVCAFAGDAFAAGSPSQVFDPFAMKLTTASSASPVAQMIRIRAEVRQVSVGQVAPVTVGTAQTGTDLRKPPIRVPYKPAFRSPFTPPGF
jgi:hypothetical protein